MHAIQQAVRCEWRDRVQLVHERRGDMGCSVVGLGVEHAYEAAAVMHGNATVLIGNRTLQLGGPRGI